ncbi:DUF3298 and DUF4163 domain-containing protein [Pedobacter deserti]|uniref:DUF3298 and DUF4163 domain-containing protein n=1 Tax=Pedobacter deserti TaxID=2817382 RepID=UPI00210E3DB6|nr:DUF3298 and DUF4163 domain-containing protein [Pedobacter sp. SYSU D00382]
MKKILSLCMFGLLAIAACNNTSQPDQTASPSQDTLRYDSVKVYAKNPVSADTNYTDTAKAVIVYPVFADKKINQLLEQHVASTIGNDIKYSGYQDIAQQFIQQYENDRAANKDRRFTWFMGMNMTVQLNKPELISILNTYFYYQGGAHPNTVFLSYNISPASGQLLTLDSLLVPGKRQELESLAEQVFRKDEGLKPTETLAGRYFFIDDRFALTKTFTFNESGIIFTYSPYEIKPYAAGKTDLHIPLKDLEGLIRPEYLSQLAAH